MEYRCLTNDGVELEKWATLCEKCFAEKPRPPSSAYFLSHVTNDPASSPSDIFVAFDPSNGGPFEFVSSVRVFHRKIIALSSTNVMGIGEVCTLKAYRRRGISEALLRYVIDTITGHDDPQQHCFLLHAAEWVRPLYRKLGFHGAELVWTKISCPKVLPMTLIRCQIVPIADHVEQLCALSNNFNQQYHGPLHRSHDYVRKWISNEATTGTVMVLIQQQPTDSNDIGAVTTTNEIKLLGYACIKEYPSPGNFQLRDFGALDSLSIPQFQYLLHEALNAMIPVCPHSTNDTFNYEVSVPLPVAQKYILGDEEKHPSISTIDDGWMWMQTTRKDITTTLDTEPPSSLTLANSMELYWPIDNF